MPPAVIMHANHAGPQHGPLAPAHDRGGPGDHPAAGPRPAHTVARLPSHSSPALPLPMPFRRQQAGIPVSSIDRSLKLGIWRSTCPVWAGRAVSAVRHRCGMAFPHPSFTLLQIRSRLQDGGAPGCSLLRSLACTTSRPADRSAGSTAGRAIRTSDERAMRRLVRRPWGEDFHRARTS
jgi:hypothetical protein